MRDERGPAGREDRVYRVVRTDREAVRQPCRVDRVVRIVEDAAEQALLRGNVNAIFTNLSRRNQGLIRRQLGLITTLENKELDPEALGELFELDHLATRMRRNAESLLVLVDERTPRPRPTSFRINRPRPWYSQLWMRADTCPSERPIRPRAASSSRAFVSTLRS